MDLNAQRAAFEERSARYARHGFDRHVAADWVAAQIESREGPVLDVGTGKGFLARALAARGLDVVSVDADGSERDLASLLAAEQGVRERIRFLTADAVALPFPSAAFAAAAAMDVLHHLGDPLPVLSEMDRTLRPGGRLVLADFSRAGFELVAEVHRQEGRTHSESGVTLDDAIAGLVARGFRLCSRRSARLHELALFEKPVTASRR